MCSEPNTRTVAPATENRMALRRQWGANLDELLRRRFRFLREFAKPGERVLELGAGIGETRNHLQGVEMILTDVEANSWLDAAVSAESLPFADASFDAVVALGVFHHLGRPKNALAECLRVLRPGGRLIIREPHASRLLQSLLSLRGHEYVDFSIDPFGNGCCQRSEDNWDGNNAIGDLFFGDRARFSSAFPTLDLVHHRFVECLIFMNSGGINHKTPYIPLPRFMVSWLAAIDRVLCAVLPDTFALGQEFVFVKKDD